MIIGTKKTKYIENIEKDLLPCPFCGCKPRLIDVQVHSFGPATYCLECCMKFYIEDDDQEDVRTVYSAADVRGQLILPPTYPQPRTFIDKWNSRVKEEDI